MKKVLFLLVALTLVSGIASASSIYVYCVPSPGTFAWGAAGLPAQNGSTSCAGETLPAGYTITSVEVYYLADFQFGQTTNGSNNTINTIEQANGAGAWASAGGSGGPPGPGQSDPYTCVTSGQFSSNTGPCTGFAPLGLSAAFSYATAGLGTNTFAAFTVSITASEVGGTNVANSSYANIVEYDYTPPVPEPASLMMVGSGLLGLGVLASKLRKKA